MLEKRRQEAISAMETAAHKAEKEQNKLELEKRRQEARQAMESPEQRAAREKLEKQSREVAAIKERLAGLKNKVAEEKNRAQTEKELERQKNKEEKARRQEEYLKHLQATNTLIEQITSSTESKLGKYRTLRGDISQTVADKNISMTDIALQERSKERTNPEPSNKRQSGWWIMIATTCLLIIVGAGSLYLALNWNTNSTQNPQVTSSIIFAEAHIGLDITGQTPSDIKSSIQNTIANLPPTNTVTNIYLTEQAFNPDSEKTEVFIINSKQFLEKLAIQTSPDFEFFLTDQFMIGVHNASKSPFLVFKTTSFARSFDALLKNERAILSNILSTIEPEIINRLAGQSISDKVIQNVDTRSVVNPTNNEIIALYAFLDQETMFFSINQEVLQTVIGLNRANSSSNTN